MGEKETMNTDYISLFNCGRPALFGDEIVLYVRILNIIMWANYKTGEVHFQNLPERYINTWGPVSSVYYFNDKLVFLPYEEWKIIIYDINKDHFFDVELKHEEFDKNELQNDGPNLHSVINEGEKLIIYGSCSTIVTLCMTDYTLSYESLRKNVNINSEDRTRLDPRIINERYLLVQEEGCLIDLKKSDNGYDILQVEESDSQTKLSVLAYCEGICWMQKMKIGEKVSIIRCNLSSQEIQEYSLDLEPIYNVNPIFGWGELYSNRLYLLPGKASQGYIFCTETGQLKKWDIPSIDVSTKKEDWGFDCNYLTGIRTEEDHLLAPYKFGTSVVDINLQNGEWEEIPLLIDKSELREIVFNNKKILHEDKYISLKLLLG